MIEQRSLGDLFAAIEKEPDPPPEPAKKPEPIPEPPPPLIPEEPFHSDDPRQVSLFETGKSWENEWKGMPEFVQEDQESFNSIVVHFESRTDMLAFSRLVGQKITENTRAIWYPEAEIGTYADKRYISVGSRSE